MLPHLGEKTNNKDAANKYCVKKKQQKTVENKRIRVDILKYFDNTYKCECLEKTSLWIPKDERTGLWITKICSSAKLSK